MQRKSLLVAVMAFVVGALGNSAAAQSGPEPSYTESGFSPVLLDASAPQATRMKAFAKVIALANQGQVRAQDLAGTMYWHGPAIKGSPLPINLGQARKLLANAAVHGDVLAMAKLAELELGAGRVTPAMIWAQLYARYLNPQRGPRRAKTNGYASTLIDRIVEAGGKNNEAVRIGVASIVNRYDDSIRQGIDTLQRLESHGETFLVKYPMPKRHDSPELVKKGGVAEYMVGFDAAGNPTMIKPLDAFPEPTLSADLRSYLTGIVANQAADDGHRRYLRVAVTHQPLKFRMLRLSH